MSCEFVDQKRSLQSSMQSLQGQKRWQLWVCMIALHNISLLGVLKAFVLQEFYAKLKSLSNDMWLQKKHLSPVSYLSIIFHKLIIKTGETSAQRLAICVYLCLSGFSTGKSVYEQQRHRNLEENWGPGAGRDQTKHTGTRQIDVYGPDKHNSQTECWVQT